MRNDPNMRYKDQRKQVEKKGNLEERHLLGKIKHFLKIILIALGR